MLTAFEALMSGTNYSTSRGHKLAKKASKTTANVNSKTSVSYGDTSIITVLKQLK